MKVPAIILSLINDPDEDWNPLRNSYFFATMAKVTALNNYYYNVEPFNEMSEGQLKDWYISSVEKDNFISLFDSNYKVDSTNFILKEYTKLVEELDNQPYDSGGNNNVWAGKWSDFFETEDKSSRKVKKLLSGNAASTDATKEARYRMGMSTQSTKTEFLDLASYSSTFKIKELLGDGKNSTQIAQEVLKAWSFYLSLRNWVVVEEEVDQAAIDSKSETPTGKKNVLQLYNQYLDSAGKKNTPNLDDLINTFNEASAAVSASKFNKQKYLIENIDDLSVLSAQRQRVASTFQLGIVQNRILKIINSKKNAINKITGAALGNEMFKMPTAQLSQLIPKIQLFKVAYNEEMKTLAEVEIDFPTTFVGSARDRRGDLDPLGEIKTKREYGIKSFSWEYKGSDPFSVDRDITATLELYFQNFGDFTAKRNGYRYVDLIVPLEKDYPQSKAILGEAFQQDIRVKAGWEVPATFDIGEIKGAKEAIKASQVDFVLHPVDYSISFDGNGNGASTITINYRARIESVGKNRLINVIGANKEEVEKIQVKEVLINNTQVDKEKKRIRKEQQEIYKEVKKKASQRYLSRLTQNISWYYRYVNLEEVLISTFGEENAKKYYKALETGKFTPDNTDLLRETFEHFKCTAVPTKNTIPLVTQIKKSLNPVGGDTSPERIQYTFLGDILQTAIELATESGSILGAPQDVLKKFKVALLDFRVGDQSYNLCDLPVEAGVLTEFLNNKIGKRDESTVSIVSFARELIADVLINRIDEYFNLQDGTTRTFKLGYISMNEDLKPNSEGKEGLIDLDKSEDIKKIQKTKKVDYLIVYSDSPIPRDYKISNASGGYPAAKRRDEQNGLHHFALGTTKGIVKNISFDKVDLEYARERRLTMNAEDPYALLANVFNVNLSMFGNNFFRPGSYIYVDPKVMGDLGNPYTKGSISNIMGLGGYHIVTSVSHQITLQSYETSLNAVWETSGDGEATFTGLKKKKDPQGKEEKK